MAQINLTDRYVQSLRGSEKRYYVSDQQTAGLRVWVSKAGKKTWSLATRDAHGRMRQFFCKKPYPLMGLAEARTWAEKTRFYVKEGGDPAQDKKDAFQRQKAETEKQHKVDAASCINLDVLIDEYQEYLSDSRRSWTSGDAQRRIRHVFSKLLNRPVVEIGQAEIEDVLLSHPSRSSASRARQYLAPVFDWAGGLSRRSRQRGRHRQQKLDVIDIHEAIDPQPPEQRNIRTRNLSDNEISLILPHLDIMQNWSQRGRARDETGPLQSQHGVVMRFLLLSAARLNEVVSMTWGDVDLDQKIWTKRGVKNTSGQKDRNEQILPLFDAMAEILIALPHDGRLQNELVFKSKRGGRLSNWDRETKRIQRLSGTSDWHRHDLREWAATTMAKQGVPIDVYERILNHSLSSGSAARRHYDRYARLEEQREALEKLGAKIEVLAKQLRPDVVPQTPNANLK